MRSCGLMTHSTVPSQAPPHTVSQAVVRANLDSWLYHRERSGRPVPRYVVAAFRKFLACRTAEAEGVTVACPRGHYARSFPVRCKGRGLCAYCLTLRQRELCSQLLQVIGNVPIVHVVLCFPPSLRCTVGHDWRLIRGGFAALTGAMFAFQRRRVKELFRISKDRVHPGGVVVHHPASANLEPNDHFHGLFPDGVFIEVESGGVEFLRLPALTNEDIARIAHQAGLRYCRALKACGFWKATSSSGDTIEGLLELGGGRPARLKFFGEAARYAEGGKQPRNGAYAFHLFVSRAVKQSQVKDLVSYVLAPAFRDDQVEWDGAGKVGFTLKRERHDGTGRVEFDPHDFLDCLAELVPRRKAKSVRYFGIYGGRARLRTQALAVRVEGHPPIERCPGPELRKCPVCGEKLQVVQAARPQGGSSSAIPPDTPEGLNTGEGGGSGNRDEEGIQGGLLVNTG